MDNEMAVKFAFEQAKKRLRALSIMGEPFRPHAYIPLDISIEKIKETLKEIGYEGEMPDIPDEVENIQALACMPLDFAAKRKDSLNILGKLLATTEITSVVVVCDTKAPAAGGGELDTLCVASVNLKDPDIQMLVPYQKESDDDVAFGEVLETKAADEAIRDSIIEGFVELEAQAHLHEHPDTDTDAYVDTLPDQFPNMNGSLNQKG